MHQVITMTQREYIGKTGELIVADCHLISTTFHLFGNPWLC
jgi:hypothetical protein